MSTKLKDYTAGRDDGLYMALKLVKDGGQKALEDEIRFRGITGIHTTLANKELDRQTAQVKKVMYETIVIAMLSVLHDTFGFGQIRCQKAINAFAKLTAYLEHGWLCWVDMIETIKQELGLEMVQDALRRADMGGKYSHPDIKDIYDEPPLVVEEDWQKLLGLLGFSEKEVAKDLWELYDEHKKPLFRYEGQYDKVMMFDFLEGMLFEKNGRKYDE